ncbi:hypothetical protein DPV79_28355 [Burkholderia reimsis]|uniref:Uncharacterized protein n=1 Tax=Burkholderia reimsis TaxID=2234132 RepID=A0A365QNJ9_9BURK|nr:hypothetical protein [Burkholderia reimsis]RBB35590.1 hypothetical protein DPV79_28355 [Burkholderia reimsis]
MKRISGLKVEAVTADRVLFWYRKKVAAEAGAAKTADRVDLNKEYTAEMNARLVTLVGTVKAKGFSAKAVGNVKSIAFDDGMTLGREGPFLMLNDWKVDLPN